MTGVQLVLDAIQAHKLLSILLGVAVWVLSVVVSRVFFHPLSQYPGPLLGKFTDFYSFYGVYKQKRTELQYEFLQKYGSPVRFSSNELVFSDIKTVSEIYGQSSAMPEKERTISEALSATGKLSLLSIVDRVQHGRVRRLLSHGFAMNNLLEAESDIMAKVELYVDIVFRHHTDLRRDPIDIYHKTHELFLDIVSLLGFGESYDSMRDPSSTAMQDVEAFGQVVPPQAFFPGFRYLPFETIRQGFRRVERLKTFARKCVTEHMQGSKEKSEQRSILRNMFAARDADTGTALSMEEMVENTIIFLVAGSSTTAITVTYLIWECGRRPEIMKRLVEEIRAAFPSPELKPTYAETSKLKYLSNVIDETLRLWGPLNTGIPRTSTGRMIAGNFFPAGAGISNNPYATARDPEVFPDPLNFDPDRWDNATEAMRLMSRPFSIGPRNCIGRHLALIGLHLTVTRMLQLYDITTDASMVEARMKQRDQGVLTPWDETLLVWAKPVHSET